ncbi:MAG: DUF4105 domain-containing protein, partial [Bradymonadaceae bacterium]
MRPTDALDARTARMGALVAAVTAVVFLTWPTGARAQVADAPWENGQSRGEDLRVKLVIFSPGDQVPNWFGHAALVVEDTRLRESRLYNYGMFSFDGTLLVKFAMGRLWFWVGELSEVRTYRAYKSQGRDV